MNLYYPRENDGGFYVKEA